MIKSLINQINKAEQEKNPIKKLKILTEPQPIVVFNSWQEATTVYYKTHPCNSDDTDKENAKVEAWVEDTGAIVNE